MIKKYRSRRTRKPRRFRRARKSMARMTKRVNVGKDLYYFRRSCEPVAFQGTGIGEVKGQGTFKLNQLPNFSEFTSLFDRYKILSVKLSFHLRQDPGAQSAAQAIFPRIFIIKDYDDSNTPANQAQIQEHGKCREYVIRPARKLNIYIKPAVLVPAYVSALSQSYIPKWRQWIDCADADVPHYGVKYIIDTLNANYQLFMTATFTMAFKDTR